MNPVTKYAVAGLAAIVLLIAMALMDGPDETQAAQDVADEAEYAAAVADGGAAKCGALGRVPLWTTDGLLVCRLPAGVKEAAL
ncbi:hypothetical protein SAMN05216344_102209 [Polaromonas sp. OV174]|uniref:hypothetical protein n=1 Tax=Polaromonas sp. OV174 TaxID=1855300 RepID=UPI0008E03366|nr:hypothetical protein [Polaromonas sp. OV174]SFB74630.1 hypothetical protein SAMN05216344_102209 [Polaromonas sp. OV174]